MKKIQTLRFLQIFIFFPLLIVLATYNMNQREEISFIMLFTSYTVFYEILLLKKRKK
ncbi:hypothetical protein UT300019_22370 [Clostridium sp. CTA-19]